MQENLLRTMIQIENSFFALAEASERNCLVICDRGTMDASAFVSKQEWDEILQRNMCDEVDIRDNRYHQVGRERIFFVTLFSNSVTGCAHGDQCQRSRAVLHNW